MKTTLALLLFSTAMIVGVNAWGQHAHSRQGTSRETTIVGEVIDPVCYLSHGSTGKAHRRCAEYCVRQGIPLAILEEKTGRVYLSLPVDHSNPNAKLRDFIAERVKVTGVIYSKGGLTGIHVKRVERVGS
ncbi:MAG: hypothetical protein N0A16_05585 [Blastocatellia bacterium]|nr:hypothetical protein [Blastocatellia bacterium]MCS7157180.1 hypothetical protein [Blastocatellia bacterium]MCX7752357.1 hypothetical protein [Blastocatellia bacterium]MDW8167238.1 hypothetical protein [Acidobacteriota bacterium]